MQHGEHARAHVDQRFEDELGAQLPVECWGALSRSNPTPPPQHTCHAAEESLPR